MQWSPLVPGPRPSAPGRAWGPKFGSAEDSAASWQWQDTRGPWGAQGAAPHLPHPVPTSGAAARGLYTAFTCPTALAFSDPRPTCGHSAPKSNRGESPRPSVLYFLGGNGGAARSGSSPLSCASSGRPEEWFHEGKSLFVLPCRPGGCSGHQGPLPAPIAQAAISMTTAGPFILGKS